MRWIAEKEHCFCLSHSEYDLLGEILEAAHDAVKRGLMEMSNAELVAFEILCEQAGLSVSPLREENLPLRRIK